MAHCGCTGQRWLAAALVAVCSFKALAADSAAKPRIAVLGFAAANPNADYHMVKSIQAGVPRPGARALEILSTVGE
jgi:hypothetical protein